MERTIDLKSKLTDSSPITLLAMIGISAVQSSAHAFIHNAFLFIDTSIQSSSLANWDTIFADNCY